MRFQKRWLCSVLFMILSTVLAAGLVAQDLDENGSLVAEEMVLDEILTGELSAEQELETEEELPEEEEMDLDTDDDLLMAEESIFGVDEELPVEEGTVEELASEVLGEEIMEEPIELPLIEEPVDEDLVLDEPVVEETVEDIPVAELLEEEPLLPMDEPADDIVEEEKGAGPLGVEELAFDALGQELVEDQQAVEAVLDEAVKEAVQDNLLPEEDLPVEEPVAEEIAIPEELMEEPVEELVEEAVIPEEPVEELVEEAPVEPIEEPVMEIVEELVEEAPAEPIEEPVMEIVEELVEEAFQEPVVEIGADVPAAEEAIFETPVKAPPPSPAPMPVAVLPVAAKELPPSLAVLMEAEALKRKAYSQHALHTLQQAEKTLKAKHYLKARTQFENAIDTLERLGRRPEDEKIRRRARRGLAETLYRWAIVRRMQNDLESAAQMASDASIAGHPKADRLIAEIEQQKIAPPPPPPPADVARWDQDDFKQEESDIARRLREGRQFYMTGEYDHAENKFKGILKTDPFNTEAIRMLEKTARKKSAIASMELDATRQSMLAELTKSWNPRDYGIEEEERAPVTGPDGPQPDDKTQSDRVRILKKMESIIVPEIEFRQANIHDVISFLQDASSEFDDVDVDDTRRGVNIILNIRSAEGEAAAPAVEDPFATPSTDLAPAATGVPLITFSARHISLLEALKIVTRVANLKYRIEGTVVMILPWDAPIGEIIVRMYDVLPSVEERISEVSAQLDEGGLGFGGGDRGGGFGSLERGSTTGEAVDWAKSFEDMGVQWPQGSSIKYVRAMGKLVVANTADNLTTFEQILAELNVVPSQIEIEARFVEVAQTDLDSLGFEWLLTDTWEVAQQRGQQNTALSGRQRVVVQENATSGGFTTGNRFLQGGVGLTGTAVADNIMTIAGVLTNPELSVVLHALQQRGSTDLLSAPKVLTQSGVEATIKVVTEYVYPTDFEVTPITASAQGGAGNSQVVGGVVEPSGFESREVGVILTVTPEVSPEGQMIDLTMMPEVVSEPVWKNYGTTYTDENGRTQQLPMEQPFFFVRSISSTISIYNGATVVMGGMITEVRNEVNDKIPFMGDIPLLGRLFRSSYEQSEKRNLLIFVTARLVDPAGRPL